MICAKLTNSAYIYIGNKKKYLRNKIIFLIGQYMAFYKGKIYEKINQDCIQEIISSEISKKCASCKIMIEECLIGSIKIKKCNNLFCEEQDFVTYLENGIKISIPQTEVKYDDIIEKNNDIIHYCNSVIKMIS